MEQHTLDDDFFVTFEHRILGQTLAVYWQDFGAINGKSGVFRFFLRWSSVARGNLTPFLLGRNRSRVFSWLEGRAALTTLKARNFVFKALVFLFKQGIVRQGFLKQIDQSHKLLAEERVIYLRGV